MSLRGCNDFLFQNKQKTGDVKQKEEVQRYSDHECVVISVFEHYGMNVRPQKAQTLDS